ncbi:10624_t:CDS:2 [Racocetra fulgida]|uniref:10624_t:CDS:1 n=1 Tax=Racocetra fulgida TaxID=60492 RepID=A0A9N8ZFX3_9GLOM|nr:10624_t:CDS:2 [Racocetra fulgida]
MSGDEKNKYLTTKRDYNETVKAYIERISKENIINFILWNEICEKMEFVDTGGSGVITKAKWIKKNITVVLKTVVVSEETNSDNDEFIKEIKAFHNIGLVLSSITNEENEEKTSLKGEITSLVGYENVIKFYDDIRAIITDFGLAKVIPRNSKSNQKIVGCVPFVAPEILNCNATPDFKSDIYSLGVVLWEITSNGRPPFDKCNNVLLVSLQIIKGARETPINGSTNSYVKLYTDCWDGNPKLRPEIDEVYNLIQQEDIISGEKLEDSSKSCISDIDTGPITPNEKIEKDEKKSNKTSNEQIFNKMLEMFGLLSTKDLEMFEQLSAKDPDR